VAKDRASAMPWAVTARSATSAAAPAVGPVVGRLPVAVRLALEESLAAYDMALPPPKPLKPPDSTAAKPAAAAAKVAKPRASPSKEPWAQCDACKKWRKLPVGFDLASLPEPWFCALNEEDPACSSCDFPQEEEVSPDEAAEALEHDKARAATGEGGAAAAPEGGAGGTKRKAGSGRPAGLDEAQLEALAKIVAQGEAPTGDKIVEAFLAAAPGRSKAAANRALREMAASPGGRGKWLLTRDACGKFGLPFVAPPAQAVAGAAAGKGKAGKKPQTAAAGRDAAANPPLADSPFATGAFVEVLFDGVWCAGVVDAAVPAGLKVAFYQDQGSSTAVLPTEELAARARPATDAAVSGAALVGANVSP
jgi:hypothetical protein